MKITVSLDSQAVIVQPSPLRIKAGAFVPVTIAFTKASQTVSLPQGAAIELAIKPRNQWTGGLLAYLNSFQPIAGNLYTGTLNCASASLLGALGMNDSTPLNDLPQIEACAEVTWSVANQKFRSVTFPLTIETPLTDVTPIPTPDPEVYPAPGDIALKSEIPTLPDLTPYALKSEVPVVGSAAKLDAGSPDGAATLDHSGKVPLAQLPVEAWVESINGRTGAVAINSTDVGLDQVNNTADIDKPVSTATQNALNSFTGSIENIETDLQSLHSITSGLQTDVTHWSEIADQKIDNSLRGAANGVAPLGGDAKVPPDFLPPNITGLVPHPGVVAVPGDSAEEYAIPASIQVYDSSAKQMVLYTSPAGMIALKQGAGGSGTLMTLYATSSPVNPGAIWFQGRLCGGANEWAAVTSVDLNARTLNDSEGGSTLDYGTKNLIGVWKLNGVGIATLSDTVANAGTVASLAGHNVSELANDTGYVESQMLGAANGVAPLGADAKVSPTFLPQSILGATKFQGLWDAAANQPAIPAASLDNLGWYFIVTNEGTTAVDGVNDWKYGDWILSIGTSWVKVDNTDAVVSVNGKTGVIVLVKGDVGLGNVDNTSDMNKPVSTAQATAISNHNASSTAHGQTSFSRSLVQANSSSDVFSALGISYQGRVLITAPWPSGTMLWADSGTWSSIMSSVFSRAFLAAADASSGKTLLGLNNLDNTSDANKPVSTAQAAAIAAKVDTTQIGAANGVAPLGADSKVPAANLPASPVTSVAGKTGAVALVSADVGLGSVTNDAQVKVSDLASAADIATGTSDAKWVSPAKAKLAATTFGIANDGSILSIVKLTQAAYNAIGTPSPTTMYVIVG